jgi:hypothetical protein
MHCTYKDIFRLELHFQKEIFVSEHNLLQALLGIKNHFSFASLSLETISSN